MGTRRGDREAVSVLSWTKNDPCEGYSLGALCPQTHSSPVCSLWSASCCNSWPEPQPHVVSGSEGQPELGFACVFWQWQRELGPPRERGGLGSPWKEIQKCWGAKTKYSVYEEASQTHQVCQLLTCASQSVVHEPALSVPPGILLETQNSMASLKTTDTEPQIRHLPSCVYRSLQVIQMQNWVETRTAKVMDFVSFLLLCGYFSFPINAQK